MAAINPFNDDDRLPPGGPDGQSPPPPGSGAGGQPPAPNPFEGYSAAEQDFLKRNQNPDGSYDFARVKSALSNDTSYRPYDSQTTNAAQQAANATADRGPAAPPRSTFEPPSILRPSSLTPRLISSAPDFMSTPRLISSAPDFADASSDFSDPASNRLAQYALDQYGRRMNPDPNSGTALYEKYARQLMDTLQQPVYSPQDESILKTRASDAIEQERSATKQRWIQELSARNIPLSSGVALDGLQRIENQFNGLRTQAEAQFATDAIAQTRQNRLQVLDTAGNLASEEEGRRQDAGNYARVPYDLQNQAFQRNLQVVNAAGSPADLAGTALGIAGFNRDSSQLNASNALARAMLALQTATAGSNRELSLAELTQRNDLLKSGNNSAMSAALLQYLGYLFG